MPLASKVGTSQSNNSYSTFDLHNKGQRISASKHSRGHTTFDTVAKDPVADACRSLASFDVKQRLDCNFNAVSDPVKRQSDQQPLNSKITVKTPNSAMHSSKQSSVCDAQSIHAK